MLPQNKQNLPKNITASTQNWQIKPIIAGFLLFFALTISSCEDPTTIGSGLAIDGNSLTTTYADTFTVWASTMRVDSAITANTVNLLVGNYQDPIFGKVTAETYFQASLPANSLGTSIAFKLEDDAVYDSLQMTFVTPAVFQGDTTKPLNMAVHQLTDDLKTTKNYTNEETVSYNSTAIATKSLVLKRYSNIDTVKIRLSDAFGKELFALSGKDETSTNDKFKAALKGFIIKNNGNNHAILALSATSGVAALRLYYHKTGATTALAFGFPLAKEARFNNIQSDFAKKINPKNDLGVSKTTYLENGVGIGTKLIFPSIKNLAKLDQFAINKAELVIQVDSIAGFNFPRQVVLSEIDNANAFIRTSNLITYLPQEGTSTIQVAGYNSTNKSYTFNITSYLYNWLRAKRNPAGFVLLPVVSDGTSIWQNADVNRAVIQNKNIQLKVYYSSSKK